MRKAITMLEFAIAGAFAIAVAAYVTHGVLMMAEIAL